MKSFILSMLAMLLLVPTIAMADDGKVSGSLSTKILPAYVLGDGTLLYDATVIQTDACINYKGFSLDVWDSKSTAEGSNFGNEVDITVSYGTLLSKEHGVGASIGATYFALSPVFKIPRGDVIKPYAEIYKDLGKGFTVYGKFEQFLPMRGSSPERGMRLSCGVKSSWQIVEGLNLNQKLSVLRDDGACKHMPGSIARYDGCLSYSLTKALSADVSVSWFVPLNRDNRNPQVVPGGGMTYKF